MERTKAQGYRVGQEGQFDSLNAFGRPVSQVEGKIVYLSESHSQVYAILLTAAGDYQSLRIN